MKKKVSRSPVIVAIIPARAGSKGFPGKNIYPILGHPMISWSIAAALECPAIQHVFVISDGANIRKVSEKYGAKVIVEPRRLGGDSIANHQVLSYANRHIRAMGIQSDIVMYLQPTSPQRNASDLAATLAIFQRRNIQAVTSVYEVENKFLKSFLIQKGKLRFLGDKPWPIMLRSLLPRTFMCNGAIFAIRTKVFTRVNSLFAPHTVPYIMPAERSIDIDYPDDARRVSTQMKKEGRTIRKSSR